MIDQFFTPRWAADLVAAALPKDFCGAIIDPAAGAGSLLEAVEVSGRKSTLLAMDSDKQVVEDLRRRHPSWVISAADSLEDRSRSSSRAWRYARTAGVDWVVLNPPFSYRGGPAIRVEFGAFSGRVSPSAQFVAISLAELRPREGMIAILPDGVVRGEKYEAFWREVEKTYRITEVADLRNTTFEGARARCRILKLVTRKAGDIDQRAIAVTRADQIVAGCRCVEIIRGRVPRHVSLRRGGARAPFLHTTDVNDSQIRGSSRDAPRELATRGPAVLFPRVGNPTGKVAILGQSLAVLSDCLIALRPLEAGASELASRLRAEDLNLSQLYRGTGAPYVTLRSLKDFLMERGFNASLVPASSRRGSCTCMSDRTATLA